MSTEKRKEAAVIIEMTNSELGTFRSCMWRWHLAYERRLRPVRVARALTVGSLMHSGIEALLRAQQRCVGDPQACAHMAIDAGIEAVREQAGRSVELPEPDVIEEAIALVGLYGRRFVASDCDRYEVLDVEREFDVKLLHGVRMRGKIDAVFRDRRTGAVVLVEHKSTSSPADTYDARSDVDTQLQAYVCAMQRLYKGATGEVVLNVMRKRAPRVPTLLKDGKVSAAACDTTREMYEAALVAQEARGVARTPAQAERLAATGTVDRFVRRHELYVPEDTRQRFLADLDSTQKLVRLVRRGKVRCARNGAACRPAWQIDCPYRPICGYDEPPVELLSGMYDVAPRRHMELGPQDDKGGSDE